MKTLIILTAMLIKLDSVQSEFIGIWTLETDSDWKIVFDDTG